MNQEKLSPQTHTRRTPQMNLAPNSVFCVASSLVQMPEVGHLTNVRNALNGNNVPISALNNQNNNSNIVAPVVLPSRSRVMAQHEGIINLQGDDLMLLLTQDDEYVKNMILSRLSITPKEYVADSSVANSLLDGDVTPSNVSVLLATSLRSTNVASFPLLNPGITQYMIPLALPMIHPIGTLVEVPKVRLWVGVNTDLISASVNELICVTTWISTSNNPVLPSSLDPAALGFFADDAGQVAGLSMVHVADDRTAGTARLDWDRSRVSFQWGATLYLHIRSQWISAGASNMSMSVKTVLELNRTDASLTYIETPGFAQVEVVNVPNVTVTNTPSVTVAGTANVNIVNIPSINIANAPVSVTVTNTPVPVTITGTTNPLAVIVKDVAFYNESQTSPLEVITSSQFVPDLTAWGGIEKNPGPTTLELLQSVNSKRTYTVVEPEEPELLFDGISYIPNPAFKSSSFQEKCQVDDGTIVKKNVEYKCKSSNITHPESQVITLTPGLIPTNALLTEIVIDNIKYRCHEKVTGVMEAVYEIAKRYVPSDTTVVDLDDLVTSKELEEAEATNRRISGRKAGNKQDRSNDIGNNNNTSRNGGTVSRTSGGPQGMPASGNKKSDSQGTNGSEEILPSAQLVSSDLAPPFLTSDEVKRIRDKQIATAKIILRLQQKIKTVLEFVDYYKSYFLPNIDGGKRFNRYILFRVLQPINNILATALSECFDYDDLACFFFSICLSLDRACGNQDRDWSSIILDIDATQFNWLGGWIPDLAKEGTVERHPGEEIEEILAITPVSTVPQIYNAERVPNEITHRDMHHIDDWMLNRNNVENILLGLIKSESPTGEIAHGDADKWIQSRWDDASALDKLVTYTANMMGDKWSNYIGPGYTGGSFAPARTLREAAERFSIRPTSDTDSIARAHDLAVLMAMNPNSIREAHKAMISQIDKIADPTTQAKAARAALSSPFLEHVYSPNNYIPTVAQKPIVNDPANNIHVSTGEIVRPRVRQGSRMAKAGYRPPQTDLTTQGIEPNPGPVNAKLLLEAILGYLDRYNSADDEVNTMLGFTPHLSDNTTGTIDLQNMYGYYQFRGSFINGVLGSSPLNFNIPIDGYTGLPASLVGLIAQNRLGQFTITLKKASGAGPFLVTGTQATGFVQNVLAHSALVTQLRTQNTLVPNQTNFIVWSSTMDVGVNKDGTSDTVGSTAFKVVKVLMFRDQISPSTDACPIQNKLDTAFWTPRPTINLARLYPFNGAPVAPVIRYWCVKQVQYISYLWANRAFRANSLITDPYWVFVTSDMLQDGSALLLVMQIIATMPVGMVAGMKQCRTVSPVNVDLANQPFVTRLDAVTESAPYSDFGAAGFGYDIIFVLTDFNGGVTGNILTEDYTVPLPTIANAALSITTVAGINDPFNAGAIPGVPLIDTGFLIETVNAARLRRVEPQFVTWLETWWKYLGNDDEWCRAFVMFVCLKYFFVQAPCAKSGDNFTPNQNIFSANGARPQDPNSFAVYGPNSNVEINSSFDVKQDMLGAPIGNINVNTYDFTYSRMSSKMEFACMIGVRTPMATYKTRFLPRQLNATAFSLHAYEFACSVRQFTDATLTGTGMPLLQMRGYITGNAGNVPVQGAGTNSWRDLQQLYYPMMINKLCSGMMTSNFNTFPIQVNIQNTYLVSPFLLDSSHMIAPWYEKPLGTMTRSADCILKFKEMTTTGATLLSIVGQVDNIQYNSLVGNVDMSAFNKLWDPSPIGMGLYLDGSIVIPGDVRIVYLNKHTQKAWYVYNSLAIPSSKDWYNIYRLILNQDPFVVLPAYTDPRLLGVEPLNAILATPDTNDDVVSIGLSPQMSRVLISGTTVMFSSNDSTAYPMNNNPTNFLKGVPNAMKKVLSELQADVGNASPVVKLAGTLAEIVQAGSEIGPTLSPADLNI